MARPKMVKTGKTAKVGKRNEQRQLHIPSTSVLAAHTYHGREGVCVGCQMPVSTHYGHRGVWLGCKGKGVAADAVLMLVPVTATPHVRQAMAQDRQSAADHVDQVVATSVSPITRTTFLYAPADRRRRSLPETYSDSYKDTYAGLCKAKEPVNASKAAKLAKHPLEANRRSLNELVRAGFVTKEEVVVDG